MLDIHEYPEAERVFWFFEDYSKVPHASYDCSAAADYLVRFAKERGLECIRDGADNVIIKKPATQGYESRPTVILQGHTDMVFETTADCKKCSKTDGVEMYRDGDLIRARGTTLGGDDGIAVAYALAILDSSDIPHPAIEAVFTSDEEVGLLGAAALDKSLLKGKIMINVDSDEEGILTVGCAGGMRTDMDFELNCECSAGTVTRVKVSGLLGGHSGMEIGNNRANAVKLLADVLCAAEGVRIVRIEGGNKDNAIPREAYADILASDAAINEAKATASSITKRWSAFEKDINISFEAIECNEACITAADSLRVIRLINKIPSGVIGMSKAIEGLVESSMNLGVCRVSTDGAHLTTSIRSGDGKKKEMMKDFLSEIAKECGAAFGTRGDYPAWEYKKDSHLRDVACRVYSEMYGKDAKVVTIHAGLECGIFSDAIEGLDCISIGPDNKDIHTTEERLSISSSVRVFEYVKRILKEI